MTMHSSHDTDIIAILERHGIYPTPQRVKIATLMLAEPQHLSAEQVLSRVNGEGRAEVSKATVYNTLGLFAEKSLLRQVIVDPSKVFYDSNTGVHHHFYNVDSGELKDIDAGSIRIGAPPEQPDDTTVEGVDVIIRVRNSR